jgi:hypothetical protein
MKRVLSNDNVAEDDSQVSDIFTTIPKIQSEMRASILIEMIPSIPSIFNHLSFRRNLQLIIKGDVWISIFQLLSHKQDVAVFVSFSLVCKQWFRAFSDSRLNEASILNPWSVNWYLFLLPLIY